MSKRLALPLIWLAAAALASTVAWQGVQIVSSQVLEPEPTDLFSQAVTPPSTSTPATPGSQPQPTASSSSVTSPTSSTTTTGQEESTTVSGTSPSSSSSSSATTSDLAAPTSGQPGQTVTQTVTQTFTLVGGTTAISFGPAGVTVIYANPNDGFSAKIEPEGTGIKVEFEAAHYESRVEAWWDDGPRSEIRERPE